MSEAAAIVTEPPAAKEPMSVRLKQHGREFLTKVTTKHGWIGDYDFVWLCMPTLPWGKGSARKLPPFYGLNDDIPILLALICNVSLGVARVLT